MARFKTVKREFASLSNDVIQGFYLSANALAVLITCLSYPNDWKYRPVHIWKNLGISRDKTYKTFDELIEKGHCIRIRQKNGNLRAEIDYIFFDEISSCKKYLEDNEKELSSTNLIVDHRWNFKKCFRHPELQEPEGWDPGGQEVTKKKQTKKNEPKRYTKETKHLDVHNSDPLDSLVPPSASAAQDSFPSNKVDKEMDTSSPELLELLEMEPEYLPYFRAKVVANWINKFGTKRVIDAVKLFFYTKDTQKKTIDNPEAWMESALKRKFAEVDKQCLENKAFAENLKKKYNIGNLKINKRYCQDLTTEKEYYYHLPKESFERCLNELRTQKHMQAMGSPDGDET